MSRGRTLLLSLMLALGGCGDGGQPAESRRWREVFQSLPGALISVSGTSEHDVWTVGGDPGDGSGAFVLHFDGTEWRRLSTGQNVDLWWVHAFPNGPVFLGGTAGTILRYEAGNFTEMATPSDATVFGIWGTTPDDLWAVGGKPTEPGSAFVWRWDGASWAAPSGLPAIPINSWFKVWGRANDDVRIVGMDGAMLEFDGQSFSVPAAITNRRLLTVYAEPAGRWTAVGGSASAVVLEDDGGGWKDVSPDPSTPAMVGVRSFGERAWAAGSGGHVLTRVDGAWRPEPLGFDIVNDFHSVWIDPTGDVWIVGGDILAVPLVNGVLVHQGSHPPPSSYE